jgi:hypothetical protein
MKRSIAAAAMAAAVFLSPASGSNSAAGADAGATGRDCPKPSMTIAYVLASNPDARVMDHIAGDLAAEFVRQLNDLPPPTDWVADEALIFEKPRVPVVLVVLFREGCAVVHTQMPREAAMLLLAGGGQAL